ncbi:hypothetical protein CTEN210_06545 [Chaetoceros tenuissimus]|uniref:Uncharacterized protein n=1 Tax=Chaetoceros tenuissimus TaxID=426638 RepID=A0AAD3CSW2_9STRA|nr:hypothetical protein CTEN210_06545 [Chaetoceros tenuissimus]
MSSKYISLAKKVLLDSKTLTQEALQHKPTSRIATRQLLQTQVSNDNQVAESLLKLDKELVLLEYHGVGDYVKQKFSREEQVIQVNKNEASDEKGKVGKVAFMITKQQKQVLKQSLNYSDQDIKGMKPVEAMLLMEHKVVKSEMEGDDDSWKETLQHLVRENEMLLEKEAQEAQKRREDTVAKSIERQEKVESATSSDLQLGFEQPISFEKEVSNALSIVSEPLEDVSKNQKDTSLSSESDKSTSESNIWYEVVEISTCTENKETTSVVGLYRTKEEANELVEIKTDLLNRRKSDEESKRRMTKQDFETQGYRVQRRQDGN